MNEPIEQLLRDADRAAADSERRPSVAAIFQRVHQRRARRVAVRSLALVIVASGALVLMLPRHQRAPLVRLSPPIDRSVQSIDTEVKSLNAEVSRRELLVTKLLKVEDETRQQIALRRRGAQRDPAEEARDELENAAFAMVYQANRIAQTAGNEPARNVYREVVAYFPNTPSAEVARQRLTQ